MSSLQSLEVLEVVGARGLRIKGGLGRLSSLLELEFNACECVLPCAAPRCLERSEGARVKLTVCNS